MRRKIDGVYYSTHSKEKTAKGGDEVIDFAATGGFKTTKKKQEIDKGQSRQKKRKKSKLNSTVYIHHVRFFKTFSLE